MRHDDIQEFDLPSASAAEFADALFNRHVATTKAEKDSLTRPIDIDPWYDRVGAVRTFTRLFEAFGVVSSPYSVEQIEQGLWFINGDPYFLKSELSDVRIPVSDAIGCMRASYHLFADFATIRAPDNNVGPLYMWWEHGWDGARPELLDAILETMERVLALPDSTSRCAALHGLGHFKEKVEPSRAVAIIQRFLGRNEPITEHDRAYAEYCRDHPVF